MFDTGGNSIKPAAGMEDMKGDMGGAAAVTGLMHALAARKAKVNAVGIIGCVENSVDGNAQRPGDIVTSMSGQTIEVLNTDAEGRLVLADALWYCASRFQPRFMVDLATLTGAIMVALGQQHAGLFSNDDELAGRLTAAGQATQERVWRMPLGADYDKLIDSKIADMKNIGGRYGGSITAAQFLQRFVKETPWAHLDIAGTAMGSPANEINQSWALGLRRAAARPSGPRPLRGLRRRGCADDRGAVLPSDRVHARRTRCRGCSSAASSAGLEGGGADRHGGAARRARCASVDIQRRFLPCPCAPSAKRGWRSSRCCSPPAQAIRTAPRSASWSTAPSRPISPPIARGRFLFDGHDDRPSSRRARRHWSALKAAGHAVTYWQQAADGRWERKA